MQQIYRIITLNNYSKLLDGHPAALSPHPHSGGVNRDWAGGAEESYPWLLIAGIGNGTS
jgi:hypothetical protein